MRGTDRGRQAKSDRNLPETSETDNAATETLNQLTIQ